MESFPAGSFFSLPAVKGSVALMEPATGEPFAVEMGVRRAKKFIRC